MKGALQALLLSMLLMSSALAAGDRDRDQGANSFAAFNNTQRTNEVSQLWQQIERSFSFSYYVSLMGPSPGLPIDQTYNNFLEGPSPLQLFHAVNLRWQFNPDWAIGATLAGIQHFTEPVETEEGFINDNNSELFNMRLYVAIPGYDWYFADAYHTFSLELPTTPGSRDDELKYGLVISQALAFALPPSALTAGWSTQFIRYKYTNHTLPPPFPGGLPTPLQTTLITTGPYVNLQLAAQWQLATSLSFDWDQRGDEAKTLEFNNNLPDRARMALNYLFRTAPFTSAGIYTQIITQPTNDTTIFGLDLALRF